MELSNEAGKNSGIQDPGIGDQPVKDENKNNPGEKNAVNSETIPVTKSTGEVAAGVGEDDINNPKLAEPTEEEMDEKLNNARDAFNDDSYVIPADEQDDGKLD